MQKLLELYKQWNGSEPVSAEKLPLAGSNREYYRITGDDGSSVIGAIGTSRDENHALYISRDISVSASCLFRAYWQCRTTN